MLNTNIYKAVLRAIPVGLIVVFAFSDIEAQKPKAENTIVYVTRKGNKYHLDSCSYLGKSRIQISLDDAKKYYQPCKVCKPDSAR